MIEFNFVPRDMDTITDNMNRLVEEFTAWANGAMNEYFNKYELRIVFLEETVNFLARTQHL